MGNQPHPTRTQTQAPRPHPARRRHRRRSPGHHGGRCQRQHHRQPPRPTPTTIPSPDPTDPRPDDPGEGSDAPGQDPQPEPEPETVEVPELSGITRAEAEQILTDHDLKATTRYRSTDRVPVDTVISQSPRAGALPGTTVTLVVAKAEPAPPPQTTSAPNCDPSYPDVCLDPAVEDYDCAGGPGNGPEYVEGPIRVRPPDQFDLDREGNGWGCENG